MRNAFPGNFPELAKIVRPYLKEPMTPASHSTKIKALQAAGRCGAPGLGADLVAFFELPYKGKPHKDTARIELEKLIVGTTTRGLPGNEALDVLAAAIKKSQLDEVKNNAIVELGDFAMLRRPNEYDRGRVVNVLKEAVKLNPPRLSTAAGFALLRHNSFDGIAVALERLDKRPQQSDYFLVCTAARKADGFGGLIPKAFNETAANLRDPAITEAKAWWANAQTSTPERVLLETLGAQGLSLPSTPSSKDYVGSLIDALAARDRLVRYAVLDLVVQRTGRTDFAAEFKYLKEDMGGGLQLSDHEPDEGFPNAGRAAMLMQQQEEKAKALRAAWDEIKDKASYSAATGMWTAPWELATEKKDEKSPKKGSK